MMPALSGALSGMSAHAIAGYVPENGWLQWEPTDVEPLRWRTSLGPYISQARRSCSATLLSEPCRRMRKGALPGRVQPASSGRERLFQQGLCSFA